jgi:hypothetical protein
MALSKPYHDNNTAPDSILIMRFDQNLNLIERRSFPLSGVNEYQTMKAVVFNQFVYFSIMELKNSHLYYSLHKVDLESDTIFSKYYNDDYFASPTIWDIDFNIADSTLLLVYTYNHPLFDTSQTIYGAKTFITYFNSDLEYNSELDTTLNMFNGVSAIFHEVDSNILFMYGIGGSLENNITAPCSSHPKLCKINIENSLVDCIDVFHNVDTACYTSLNNIVQIGANLYCFGFFNVRPLEMPWQYDRTYILLAKVDTALQIQNIRLVGEDYCYMTFASCATADSNVVVAGTYFDYNASDERYQVFLLKTDQNLSLGIHDQEDLWNDLSVYSNPASNNITLEIPDNNTAGLVYIFNSAGSVVKSVLLEGNQKIIDVSGLVAGNYFISFITENGQAYSGQFVKE